MLLCAMSAVCCLMYILSKSLRKSVRSPRIFGMRNLWQHLCPSLASIDAPMSRSASGVKFNTFIFDTRHTTARWSRDMSWRRLYSQSKGASSESDLSSEASILPILSVREACGVMEKFPVLVTSGDEEQNTILLHDGFSCGRKRLDHAGIQVTLIAE